MEFIDAFNRSEAKNIPTNTRKALSEAKNALLNLIKKFTVSHREDDQNN